MWYPREIAGSRSNVQIAAKTIAGGYAVEASIPWSDFAVTPQSGSRYGFALAVSDNDNVSYDIQQTMVSSVQGRKLLNPTTWGELILLP